MVAFHPGNARKRNIPDWTKSGPCLYRHTGSGTYYARIRFGGVLHRKSLRTTDFKYARRLLSEFRHDLERTDPRSGKMSFGQVLGQYEKTLGSLASGTQYNKRKVLERLRRTWHGVDTLPLRNVKPSHVEGWLSRHYGAGSASGFNQALTVIRDALQQAEEDRVIATSPAAKLKYRKPIKPIRLVPSQEEFEAIVANVRQQQHGEESADFVELAGSIGLGQAELKGLRRCDINFRQNQITTFRHKTGTGFTIPLYPRARVILERLTAGKRHEEKLLGIGNVRKSLFHACERLGLPHYSLRSFRRMFVTRALRSGVDVATVARWQGHRDGGKLILDTYSDVIGEDHSNAMAQLLK